MNFGEIKTAIYSQIPPQLREEISTFEFGEAIDAAQRLFAIVLPAETIPDIIVEKFIDRGNDVGAKKILPLPADFLRAEDVSFATARNEDGDPIRMTARMIGPEEFMELENNTNERIASVYNGLLHVHPEPVAAVEGEFSAVKMTYRKRPRPYMSTAAIIQNAARMHLQQDFENKRIFYCTSYDTGDGESFSYWGLDASELIGGYAYIGAPYMYADSIGPMYVARITMAWEEDITEEARILISSDDIIPFADDPILAQTGFLFPYCMVAQRQVFGAGYSATEAEDWEFPDLGPNWHNLVVDYALARLEVRWNPESSGARMQRVMQALGASGAKLDYTKEN